MDGRLSPVRAFPHYLNAWDRPARLNREGAFEIIAWDQGKSGQRTLTPCLYPNFWSLIPIAWFSDGPRSLALTPSWEWERVSLDRLRIRLWFQKRDTFWCLVPQEMVKTDPWSLKKPADPDPIACDPWSRDCDPRSPFWSLIPRLSSLIPPFWSRGYDLWSHRSERTYFDLI